MSDEVLPGSPSGTYGPGADFPAGHKHRRDRGWYTLECNQPGCGWLSEHWKLDCAICAQWAPADYVAHILAAHLDETIAAIARLS